MNDTAMTTAGVTDELVVDVNAIDVTFAQPGGGENRVFENVSFQVRRGELVVVIGQSGGGKTTLLNLLSGALEPHNGSVSVMGLKPVDARSRMAIMLARDSLLPWRTAQRNVEFGLELRGVPKKERRERAARWLAQVELSQYAKLWPWQLSQGMRQRVALARTWALQADLLLLDEPFAALDAQTRERIQREFLKLWESDRRSVVFVTHDLEEAIMLADRVVVIGSGRVLAEREVRFDRPRVYEDLVASTEFRELLTELRGLILT